MHDPRRPVEHGPDAVAREHRRDAVRAVLRLQAGVDRAPDVAEARAGRARGDSCGQRGRARAHEVLAGLVLERRTGLGGGLGGEGELKRTTAPTGKVREVSPW